MKRTRLGETEWTGCESSGNSCSGGVCVSVSNLRSGGFRKRCSLCDLSANFFTAAGPVFSCVVFFSKSDGFLVVSYLNWKHWSVR